MEESQLIQANSSNGKRQMTFDEILHQIGEFGRFQIITLSMFAFALIPMTSHTLIMYFAALNPPWECTPGDSMCTRNGTFSSDDNTRCSMPRDSWRYTQPTSFSVVTEFDLSCSRQWFIYLTTSIFFFGWLIGSVFIGWAADLFGRKTILYPCLALVTIIAFASSFATNIWFFVVGRLFTGIFYAGTTVQMFIILVELVGPKYRAAAGIGYWGFFSAGLFVMGLKAYFIPNWKTLYIASTIPYIIIIVFCFFTPESMRWLQSRGRDEEALEIFKRIAKFNKKELPEDIQLSKHNTANDVKSNPMDLFRPRATAVSTLIQGKRS